MMSLRGIDKFKEEYNTLMARYKKAEQYLDNCTDEQFEKWKKEFLKIVVQLSGMMKEYKELTGKEMSKSEVLDGFQ